MKLPLVLAALVTVALAAPGASPALAAANNGSFQQSGEANKSLCERYRDSFLGAVRNAVATKDEGARKSYNNDALEYWKEAKALGCGWVKTGAQRN